MSLTSMTIKYENPWRYNKKVFESTDINEYYGFVYRIINNTNGREYIGRKYFWKFRTPKGKKRKVKSESDWKKYYGSCPELKEEIGKIGRENFSRTILSPHNSAFSILSRAHSLVWATISSVVISIVIFSEVP